MDGRVRHTHVDGREIDFWQWCNREEVISHRAEQQDSRRQQRCANRPANEWLRNAHALKSQSIIFAIYPGEFRLGLWRSSDRQSVRAQSTTSPAFPNPPAQAIEIKIN